MEDTHQTDKKLKLDRSVLIRRLKKSKFYKLIYFGLWTLGIVGVVYIILSLNIFYIETIEIETLADSKLEYLNEEEIRESLVDIIGQRFFSVNPGQIEEEMIEKFTFVKEIYVTKRIPDSVIIRLSERNPQIVVGQVTTTTDELSSSKGLFDFILKDSDVIIDEEGVVLAQCNDEGELCNELPRCVHENTWGIRPPGSTVYFTELSGIVEIDSLFSDGSYSVSGYAVPETDVVVSELEGGERVIFSLDKSIPEQFSTFEYTVENLSVEGKSYMELDLRYDRPVLRVDKYTSWVTE